MRHKLTRAVIDEIRKEMPMLDVEESRNIIGGGDIVGIRIKDGYLVSYDYSDVGGGKFTSYQPDNGGQTIIFDGVLCSNGSLGGCPYQFCGIKVGPDPESNFGIEEMIHEYGHFLQQEEMGAVKYVFVAGSGSYDANHNEMYTSPESGCGYYDQPNECDASLRGQKYIMTNYPNCGYKACGL